MSRLATHPIAWPASKPKSRPSARRPRTARAAAPERAHSLGLDLADRCQPYDLLLARRCSNPEGYRLGPVRFRLGWLLKRRMDGVAMPSTCRLLPLPRTQSRQHCCQAWLFTDDPPTPAQTDGFWDLLDML